MLVVLGLQDLFLDDIGAQIAQRFFNHHRHAALDGFYLDQIVRVLLATFGKQHDVHLRLLEESVRTFAEHHRRHVLDAPAFRHRLQQVHLLQHRLHIVRQRHIGQGTFHLYQIVVQQQGRDVFQRNLVVASVVKRRAVGQVQQFALVFVLGHDATAVIADIIVVGLLFCGNVVWHLVGAAFAWRHLDDKNRFAVGLLHIHARLVVWPHQVVVAYHILLDRLNLIEVDANYRANGATIHFLHANHDIATARLVKVVGEGADSAVDGIGVPSRLVFYAFAFHSATAEQFFYVDGESHICR